MCSRRGEAACVVSVDRGWCPEAHVTVATHHISSSASLSPPSHHCVVLLYKRVMSWHLAECCMGRCTGGTLSAPITPMQHVLRHMDEWKGVHTGCTHTHTHTHSTHIHIHMLALTGHWEDTPLVFPFIFLHVSGSCELENFSPEAPTSFRVVFFGNDLWVWGKAALHDSTFHSVWMSSEKKRNVERENKERMKLFSFRKHQTKAKTPVKQ